MLKKTVVIVTVLSLFLSLAACTAKLTTIRPTLITRIVVMDSASGARTEHWRKTSRELDWLMDDLVFLMERQYKQAGKCADSAAHLYDVDFFMDERLELRVSIHSDGSVCKKGRQYLPKSDDAVDPSADLAKWAEFIAFNVED